MRFEALRLEIYRLEKVVLITGNLTRTKLQLGQKIEILLFSHGNAVYECFLRSIET